MTPAHSHLYDHAGCPLQASVPRVPARRRTACRCHAATGLSRPSCSRSRCRCSTAPSSTSRCPPSRATLAPRPPPRSGSSTPTSWRSWWYCCRSPPSERSWATGAALGPTFASAVLAVAQWRWLFGINVPLGVITILIAIRALPETERTRRPLNPAGAALYAGTFGLLLSGLQSLAHHAATALALVQIGCGCGLGWLLARHELPRAAPLIPFDLLRIR